MDTPRQFGSDNKPQEIMMHDHSNKEKGILIRMYAAGGAIATGLPYGLTYMLIGEEVQEFDNLCEATEYSRAICNLRTHGYIKPTVGDGFVLTVEGDRLCAVLTSAPDQGHGTPH
jgi:hypothetical protein